MFKKAEAVPFNDIVIGSFKRKKTKITLTRGQVLWMQFSKLLNFFPDVLAREWGGGLDSITPEELAKAKFIFETTVMAAPTKSCWLYRNDVTKPWGPGNWSLRDVPNRDLGQPFEPYFSCNQGLISLNQASRVLGLDVVELLQLKLKHLIDELVVLEGVKMLLRPPPLWAKYESPFKGNGSRAKSVSQSEQ